MEILESGAAQRVTLDRLRAERVACETELDQVSAATLSVDDAMTRVMTRLGQARDRAASYFTGFARPGSAPDPLAGGDLLGALLWLDPAGFEKQLRARLKSVLPGGTSLSARTAAIAKLQQQLADLDEAEEQEICRLESLGLVVDRRADVDLTMLLEVWDRTAA